MPVLESGIERACRAIAEQAGCKLVKIATNRGWPDRMLLCPKAKIVFMEFKRPGEDLRPLQKFVLTTLAYMGFRVETVTSKDQFKQILADTLQSPGSHTITKPGL